MRAALRPLAALALLACLGGLTACRPNRGQDAKAPGLNLTVGALVPLSGQRTPLGQAGLRAVGLAAQQVQAGAAKAKMTYSMGVKQEDEGREPADAAAAVRALRRQGATCLVGPYSSAALIDAAPTVVSRETLLISPAASADAITRLRDAETLNRTVQPDVRQGPALGELLDRELGGAKGKRVNIGRLESTYGRRVSGAFAADWKARGGEVGAKVEYGPAERTYREAARRLVAGRPDAFVFFDVPESFRELADELEKTRGWSPAKTFAADGLAAPQLAAQPRLNGLRGVAPGAPVSGPTAKAFDKLFTTDKVKRQSYDAQAFDAAILCFLSAVAADSTKGGNMADKLRQVSGPPGRKYTFEQLPEAIKALEAGQDIDYEGASGPIDLDARGDPSAGTYDFYSFSDGALKVFGHTLVTVRPADPERPAR